MKFHAEPSSGHPYAFDDRQSNTGGSPVETVLSALASCSAMDVVSILAKKRQDVSSYTIEVTGDQRDEYPQVFGEITVVHELEGSNLSEAAIRRAIELSATKYCPVNAMVSAGATVVHHRYRIRSGGAHAYESEREVLATGPYRRVDVIA
jgi:putative redox protein